MKVVARRAYDDLLQPLDEYEKRRRAEDAAMLARLGELDEEWPDDPAVPELACELAIRHGISAHTACERLRIARALRQLPHIARAHRDGRLSWDQLRWVTRFATPETDREWSQRASSMRPLALREEFLRQQKVTRLRAQQDEAVRSFRMEWDEERRLLAMWGTLAGDKAVAFEAAVKKAAQQVPVEDDVDDRKGARQADALVGLVTSSGRRTRPATLVLHAGAEILAEGNDGERRLAETSGGIQLSQEAVRRVACDAKVRVALEREDHPVGVVTTGRGVTESQLELLWFRDRHCTFPGCEATWFVQAHHIRHWADGGETTLENLTLLCSAHHRKLHEGGWTIRGRPPDGLMFVNRSERVLGRASPELARAG
jgi:Domain of unknown function (DUF222)/HNH endonuclease